MKQLKYANLILTEPPPAKPAKEGGPDFNRILMINNEFVKGAFHVNCAWISPGPNPGVLEAHKHPHDEILGFIGTNSADPSDLGAEAELWIDDERYIITKSFLAYFPTGLVHCPLTVTNVKRAIFHFDIQMTKGNPEFQWTRDHAPGV